MNAIATCIRVSEVPEYDQNRILGAFASSDSAENTTARGRVLEELVAYLFSGCEGVRHHGNNILNAAQSSEIDVCFWNNQERGSLDFLPQILVAECKNTSATIGSAELRIFLSKLQEMRLTHGIFVAAHGITGNQQDLRAAHDVVRTGFQREGIRTLVIDRREVEDLNCTEDLVLLLQDKLLLVTMQAQSFSV